MVKLNSLASLLEFATKYWTVLIAATVCLGYISFYAFCSANNIGSTVIDIPLVISMGLYGMLMSSLIFYNAMYRQTSLSPQLCLIISFILITGIDEGYIAGLFSVIILCFYMATALIKKDNPLKVPVHNYIRYKHYIRTTKPIGKRGAVNLKFYSMLVPNCWFFIIYIFILYFQNQTYFKISIYFLILIAITRIALFVSNKQWPVLAMLALVFSISSPIFIFPNLGYSLMGVSRQNAKIELNDSTIISGTIIFETSSFIFIKNDTVVDRLASSQVKKIHYYPLKKEEFKEIHFENMFWHPPSNGR